MVLALRSSQPGYAVVHQVHAQNTRCMHKTRVIKVMCCFTVSSVEGQQLFTQVCEMNGHAVSSGHAILMEH